MASREHAGLDVLRVEVAGCPLAARLFRRTPSEARELSYGDIEKAYSLRGDAYRRALVRASEIGKDFAPIVHAGNALGIDMGLIVRKFLVETLFKRYEFLGLAQQFAAENPSVQTRVIATPLYGESLPSGATASAPGFMARLTYLGSLLALPIYGRLFALRNRRTAESQVRDAVICEVDSPKIRSMFADIFGNAPHYVTERHYLPGLGESGQGVLTHALGSKGLGRIARLTAIFLSQGVAHGGRLSRYGGLLFDLYGTLVRGILLVPPATRSVYFAYEHLFTTKAVRNEFMRVDGNKTVSLPYGTHADSHFFAPAHQYNYDILCAAGPLQEQIYGLQRATTKVMLPTGSYESQKIGFGDVGRADRVQRLLSRKGSATSITILSSGIQDLTRSGEIKLMALARQLAAQPDVCVFFRPKPTPPPEKFRNFYTDGSAGLDNFVLTGPEYQLTDFLDATDLFVTFWSHSGADLCAAGAQVFSVDFMSDEAVPLWQTVVDGCFLDEATAFESIMAWVSDEPKGARHAHAERMRQLRQLLNYQFDSFDAYKENLLQRLGPYMPRKPLVEAQGTR